MGAVIHALVTGLHLYDARIAHGNTRLLGAPWGRPATVKRAADDHGRKGKAASAQRVACQAGAGSSEDTAKSHEPGRGCVRRGHQTDAAGPGELPDAQARGHSD